jgi:hypothetical protein
LDEENEVEMKKIEEEIEEIMNEEFVTCRASKYKESSKMKAQSPIVTRKKKDSSKMKAPSPIEEIPDLKKSGDSITKSSPGLTLIPYKFNSAPIFRINHIIDCIGKAEKK